MAQGGILVINPNSNPEVTAAIDAALQPLRFADGPALDCVTLAQGPFGIESDADVEHVGLPLRDLVGRSGARAFIIACFSDPGLQLCRAATSRPVFGIAQSAVLTALAQGNRFGVVAILEASIPRHQRYLSRLGLLHRLAGERALGLRVHELADAGRCRPALIETATALKERDAAEVLILGCAGLARYRRELEARLRIPVIDPTQAAAVMAMGALAASGVPS